MISSGYGTYLHIFTTVYLPHNSNPDFNQNYLMFLISILASNSKRKKRGLSCCYKIDHQYRLNFLFVRG